MGKLINPGRLTSRVTLLRPSTPAVDELGGLQSVSYIPAKTLFARYESKNLSQQELVGDYVTADTRYFLFRDLQRICPDIDSRWRLSYKGMTWIINNIERVTDRVPYYVQITATAVNQNGRML